MFYAIDDLRMSLIYHEKRLKFLNLSKEFVKSNDKMATLLHDEHYTEARIEELHHAIECLSKETKIPNVNF